MPTYELTSPRTGLTHRVDFDGEPAEADMEEAVAFFDADAAKKAGVDPAILAQGPLGTAVNQVPQTFAKVGTNLLGGASRLLGKATDVVADWTGTEKGGLFDAGARAADVMQEEAEATYPTNPFNTKSATVAGGAAQGMSLLAGGAAAKVLGLGNAAMTTVPLVAGGLAGVNEGVKTAEEIGVQSPEGQLAMGVLFGGVEAVTERLGGIGGKQATAALTEQAKAAAAEMLKRAAKSIASEAGEEVIAGGAQDLITRAFAMEDPNRPGFTTTGVELPKLDAKMLQRRGLEALGGAAGGAVFAGAQALANRGAGRQIPEAVAQEANPLNDIAARAGRVDVAEAAGVTGLDEHVGDLTAADVADLETNDFAGKPGMGWAGQQALAEAAAAARGGRGEPMPRGLQGLMRPGAPGAAPVAGRPAGVKGWFYQPPGEAAASEAAGPDIAKAWETARAGSSTAMVPIAKVYEAARQENPQLSPDDFMAAVQEAYDDGRVLAEPAELPATLEAAGRFTVKSALGPRGVYMTMAPDNMFSTLEEQERRYEQLKEIRSIGWLDETQLKARRKELLRSPETIQRYADLLNLDKTLSNNTLVDAIVRSARRYADNTGGEPNAFARGGDSGLSAELEPGNLPGDAAAATPAEFTDAEAQARVDQLSRSLAAGGQLRSGQRLLPAAAGKLSGRSRGQLGFARAFAGLFGRRVVAVDGLRADDWGGVTNQSMPDTVFFNPQSPRAVQTVVGHEMLHHLQREHPDLYRRMDQLLEPEIRDMDKARERYAAYEGDSSVRAEVYADLLGESLNDPAFWDRMATREPGIFMPLARAVWTWFQDVLAALKLRGWSASPYFKDLAKAQDVLAQAMVEFARRHHGMTPQQAQAAVREVLTQRDNLMEGGGMPNETQARFASPRAEDRVIDGPRRDEQVAREAEEWLAGVAPEAAVEMFAAHQVPLALDAIEHAAGKLIAQLSGLATNGTTEVQRMAAHVLAQRMARVWTMEYLSADPARALRQRAVVNDTILAPIAPMLAAQEVLADRAQAVLDKRFEGGTEGGAAKVRQVAAASGQKAGESLAAQLSTDQVLQELTETWQKIMEQLTVARQGGGKALNSVRARLQAQREAARQRRAAAAAAAAAANQFADLPGVEFSDEAIIGAALQADGTVDFNRWRQAMRAELGEAGAVDLQRVYAEASRLFHQELAEQNLAESARGGQTPSEARERALRDAEEVARQRAEQRASQLIYRTEERLRQGSKDLQPRGVGADTINRAFREQVAAPLPWVKFAARLGQLQVSSDVAARLFRTAEREAADQDAMRVYRADQTRAERAAKRASELIYRTEERLRQGSKDTQKSRSGDSINQAFRDQVDKPLEAEAFKKRLEALNVPGDVAARLFRTAAREAGDRAKRREFKGEQAARELMQNEPALARLLNQLRAKMVPGLKWEGIFSELPDAQKERQRAIYERLMKDERLARLNAQERLQLTNELDKAWQRERRKVFKRELKKAAVVGEKKESDRQKVEAAAPRLLRLMNLGLLNSELFREALAKEYGVKVIDAEKASELRALGERIQNAPDGVPRRKLEAELMARLQELTDSTLMQLLESYWTAAVLSGWRTQVDIALGVMNGIEDVGLGALVTAVRTGNKDVAWRAIGSMIGNLPQAAGEALDHLWTGNRTLMRNMQIEARQALEEGSRMSGDAGMELWNKGGWRKVPGGFMIFYARLLAALDHINSTSTARGARVMALARHPELYRKSMLISAKDRAAAGQQARQELLGGRDPKTQQERVEIRARVQEILDSGTPLEVTIEAQEIGRQAALQGDPTGLGYALMYAVRQVVGVPALMAQQMEKAGMDNAAARAVMFALRGASTTGRVLTGTKFIRTVAHSINRTLSYAPGLGLLRFAEGGMKGARADILLAKQITGTVVGLSVLAMLRARDDDEEGLEGSWEGLSGQEKSQLYAQGKQPYSVWYRDAAGKIVSFNYQQWGVAGVLATLGAMEDQRRYNGHNKGDLTILINGIAQGMMSWSDKAQLQGLQTVFDSGSRSSDVGLSLAERLNKYAAQTLGGLVPRIGKDFDAVIRPELHDSSEWWMKWAQQVPMVRELSSGKRVDIFGKDILLDRTPTSRVVQFGNADPAYRILGRLNERDIWLTDPSAGERVVKFGDGTRRAMNPHEKDRYQRYTGAAYREYILKHGEELLRMDEEDARKRLARDTGRIRASAFYKATH